MKNLPLSVIIPVYNAVPYLRACLDSVLGQTCPVEAVICVDDGSTDASLGILREYEAAWESVHVIHKPNGGQTSARKAGLEIVTTPYTTFVDADDWIEPQMYEVLMEAAVRENADIVSSGYFLDFGHRQDIVINAVAPGRYEGTVLRKLQRSVIPTDGLGEWRYDLLLWDKIFRTDFLRPFQMDVDERIRVGEDNAVVWPALLQAKRVFETGRAYYHYCQRSNSVMNDAEMKEGLVSFRELRRYLSARLLPMHDRVENIAKQLRMFETNSIYSAGRWCECKELFGAVLRPFGGLPKGSRVALYGAGKFGRRIKSYLEAQGVEIVTWVDQMQSGTDVQCPSALIGASFDFLLVGALKRDAVQGILARLGALGVPAEKIRRMTAERILEGIA